MTLVRFWMMKGFVLGSAFEFFYERGLGREMKVILFPQPLTIVAFTYFILFLSP